MPMSPAPLGHSPHGSSESILGCLPLYHPLSIARLRPVVREAEQVEARAWLSSSSRQDWPTKLHQARLLRVKSETVFGEPLAKYRQHPLRVYLSFEDDHRVVGIANESRAAAKPRSHLFCKPRVEHF